MHKKLLIGLLVLSGLVFAQKKAKAQTKGKPAVETGGYNLSFTVKDLKDSACYLTKYMWDKTSPNIIVDTAKLDKKGTVVFSGKKKLEKGIYSLIAAKRLIILFDVIVGDNQSFSIATDTIDYYKHMKITGSPENEDFLNFVIFMSSKNKERMDYEKEVMAKKTADSTKLITEKNTEIFKLIKAYQKDYLKKNPSNYMATIIRLQMDLDMSDVEIPKASNNRPDSVWQYNYYKNHYWDGIDLTDLGVLNTNKLYYDKLKKYIEKVVLQHPDTLIKECDRLIEKVKPNKEMYKYMVYFLTYTMESSKIMGMDAVFVHIAKKYYCDNNTAFWLDKKTLDKICDRATILYPLLLNNKITDCRMMDTTGTKTAQKLGIDTITDSKRLTDVYLKNRDMLDKLQINLYSIKADYTILVFWDVDCGHCKKEIPVLLESYHKLKKEGYDIQVMAVYTKDEYNKWRQFIKEQKLDWINVADGIHLNNITKTYDIFSTPVIYMLNKDKVIKAKRIGADQVEDVIKIMKREMEMKK